MRLGGVRLSRVGSAVPGRPRANRRETCDAWIIVNVVRHSRIGGKTKTGRQTGGYRLNLTVAKSALLIVAATEVDVGRTDRLWLGLTIGRLLIILAWRVRSDRSNDDALIETDGRSGRSRVGAAGDAMAIAVSGLIAGKSAYVVAGEALTPEAALATGHIAVVAA